MRTNHNTCSFSTRPLRRVRSHKVLGPVAGQCFEIDISHESGHWVIRIPEINAATKANTRAAVELAARECITTHTGIPIGYISVWTRD